MLKFRLSKELADKVKLLSEESGFSVSEIVRACIDRALLYVEDRIKQIPPSGGNKEGPNVQEKQKPVV
jgi:hypothetical protein